MLRETNNQDRMRFLRNPPFGILVPARRFEPTNSRRGPCCISSSPGLARFNQTEQNAGSPPTIKLP